MLGGRRKLPVLAEISGSAGADGPVCSLRRADLEALTELQAELDGQRVVLVGGDARLAAAIALAAAASAGGRQTLLLECDLLRPRLATSLGLARQPGLHEYLRWEAKAPEILQPLALAGPAARGASHPLVCVVAGRQAAALRALVDLDSFRHAIARLRSAYEQIFLLAPALDLEDGSVESIAGNADGFLAAVSPQEISGGSGRALRARLRRLPLEAQGAIVVGDAGSPSVPQRS